MALRTVMENSEIAHKAEMMMGNTVTSEGGILVAQPKETGLINFESEETGNENDSEGEEK